MTEMSVGRGARAATGKHGTELTALAGYAEAAVLPHAPDEEACFSRASLPGGHRAGPGPRPVAFGCRTARTGGRWGAAIVPRPARGCRPGFRRSLNVT